MNLPPFSGATPSSNSGGNTTAVDSSSRRLSTRSIKRKKFDDELVESSLKSDRSRVKTDQKTHTSAYQHAVSQSKNSFSSVSFPNLKIDGSAHCSSSLQSTSSVLSPGSDLISVDSPGEVETLVSNNKIEPTASKPFKAKFQPSKLANKRPKKNKPCTSTASLWKPQDDLALITAVQQTCDLSSVHLSGKFSRSFSLTDIKERWFSLLYNTTVSRPALNAIRQLPSDTVDCIERRAPFSVSEEGLLKTITNDSNPGVEAFERLLEDNHLTFSPARTAMCLLNHWALMREYDLLPFKNSKAEKLPNFFTTLDKFNDSDLLEHTNTDLDRELQMVERQYKREMVKLEEEVSKWKVIVKNVVGITTIDFDDETYAILKGRLVQFLMKAKEMTLGRNTDDSQVDADLSLEGPAHKVSRKHFTIRLEHTKKTKPQQDNYTKADNNNNCHQLHFCLVNHAKRPILVNGSLVAKGGKAILKDNSIVEVSCLRFSFFINEHLLKSLNHERLLSTPVTLSHHSVASSSGHVPSTATA